MKTTLLNAKLGTSLTDILNRLHLTQQRLSLRKTEITYKILGRGCAVYS